MVRLLFVKMLWGIIPSIILFALIFPYRKYTLQGLDLLSGRKREYAMFCYTIIIGAVLALKLCPICLMLDGYWGNILILTRRPSLEYHVNLVPFGSFADYYEWIRVGMANPLNVVLNRIGNILSFAVIGFLTFLLFRKVNIKYLTIFTAVLSASCEVVQYFLVRYSSVDDVLLNTSGIVLGYYLYRILCLKKPDIVNHFKVYSNPSL